MGIRRRLTEVAVDSFTDYLRERLEHLKELDLDKDGIKDVDQMKQILLRCGSLTKDAIDSTDFQKLAAGLEQIGTGVTLIRNAVDGKKLQAISEEISQGLLKLGELAQLGIKEVKERRSSG